MDKVSVYTDACYMHLKEKPIFCSFVIIDEAGAKIFTKVVKDKAYSSTYAEYVALLFCLRQLSQYKYGRITVYADNMNMVKQMKGSTPKVVNLIEMKTRCRDEWLECKRAGNIMKIEWTKGANNLADKYVRLLKKEYVKKCGK